MQVASLPGSVWLKRASQQGYIGTIVLVLYKNYFASRTTGDVALGQVSAQGAGGTYQTFFTSMSLWAGLLLCISNLFALHYWPREFQRVMGDDSILELEVVRPRGTHNDMHAFVQLC